MDVYLVPCVFVSFVYPACVHSILCICFMYLFHIYSIHMFVSSVFFSHVSNFRFISIFFYFTYVYFRSLISRIAYLLLHLFQRCLILLTPPFLSFNRCISKFFNSVFLLSSPPVVYISLLSFSLSL